jgi:hypothetical protein
MHQAFCCQIQRCSCREVAGLDFLVQGRTFLQPSIFLSHSSSEDMQGKKSIRGMVSDPAKMDCASHSPTLGVPAFCVPMLIHATSACSNHKPEEPSKLSQGAGYTSRTSRTHFCHKLPAVSCGFQRSRPRRLST